MIGEHPRMIAKGPFGTWVPAFAYDLTSVELAQAARSAGLVRYGKTPNGDEDKRPIGLAYKTVPATVTWATKSGGVNLRVGDAGPPVVYIQPSSVANEAKGYTSSVFIGKNAGWYLRCFLYEHAKTQNLKLHQWRWGVAGKGYLFQIRNGTPEIAALSEEFNESDLAALHVLWAEDDPDAGQTSQINDLIAKLFINFESLSFERGLGKSDWFNTVWTVAFVPEPRGVLHIVLQGADATAHENTAILETKVAGTLWGSTGLEMFTGGGTFWMETGTLQFERSGRLDFGPFQTAYWLDSLGDVSFAKNAYFEAGKTNLSFEMLEYEGYEINFGFRAELQSLNRTQTPWLYGLSARLAPGTREVSDEVVFDTDDLHIPIGMAAPPEPNVILDIQPYAEGPFLERTVKVIMSDTLGWLTKGRRLPHDRLADVTIDGAPVITEGIIATLEQTDMRALQAPFATVRTSDQFQSSAESELIAELKDGWHILKETDCDPPPILDGLPLNNAAKVVLAIAGYSGARVSGIANGGKPVSSAALGEDWVERPDGSKCADVIRALFESYGYGQRIFQDVNGIWNIRSISSEVVGSFSSSGEGLSLFTEPGKLAIFKPIDIMHDSGDFYNHFVVIGGKDGKLTGEWTNWPSITQPNSKDYIGRRRTYRITNTGLATDDDVQYALRSLIWMYGRKRKFAQFNSWYHNRFQPCDVIECDGNKYEIEGVNSASWAKNECNFALVERANI